MRIIKIGSIVKIKTSRNWCGGVYDNTIGTVINIEDRSSRPDEYKIYRVRLCFKDARKVEKLGFISEPTVREKFLFSNNIIIRNE